METKKIYYYRIFDDKEQMNYIKSTLERPVIVQLLKDYEVVHQDYFNKEFITFLREKDADADLIEVGYIYY